MKDLTPILSIIILIVLVVIVWHFLKPYIIHYDTTLLFCGGLGSGKSLNSVKYSLILYKKVCYKVKIINFKSKIKHFFNKKYNVVLVEKPWLISTIPIKSDKKIISHPLTKDIILLKSFVPQYSVVLIDEMPLLVNQFNWSIPVVQNNLNEFIAMFRHYIGGYLICNGQAESEIVKQVRSKLNSYFWCYDFRKFLIFYRVRIMHSMSTGDQDISLTSDFVEDNTKWTYGLLLGRHYDSRCYRYRYLNSNLPKESSKVHTSLSTNSILRFSNYISPLDSSREESENK